MRQGVVCSRPVSRFRSFSLSWCWWRSQQLGHALLKWMPGAERTSGIPSPSEQKIVAVLPFRVLGDRGALEHIANGLSESLSAKLFQLKDVKVASNASIERVNRDQPLAKIGHDLGVNLVLTGTVRGEGDRIRIVANLEDTVNGRRIWAQEFTGVRGDLLTLEDGIFAQLLTALSITPGSEERSRSATRCDAEHRSLRSVSPGPQRHARAERSQECPGRYHGV